MRPFTVLPPISSTPPTILLAMTPAFASHLSRFIEECVERDERNLPIPSERSLIALHHAPSSPKEHPTHVPSLPTHTILPTG